MRAPQTNCLKENDMKRWMIAFAAFSLGLTAVCAPAAEQTYTLTLSTWGTPKHPQVRIFVPRFMALAEKESGGRLKFKYFPNGMMVKEAFVDTAVPNGTVDISLTTMDNWAGRAPAVGVTTTPLWPYAMAQDKTVLEPGKPLFEYFNALLEKSNARIIALFDIGPAVVSTNFALRTPAEIKGKVIRAVSKGSAEVLRALGASPVVLSVGDVYSALQRHTIDGAFSGLGAAAGLKYYEVSKYLMGTNGLTGAFINGYVMNLAKLGSLPSDLQKVLLSAAAQARDETQDELIKAYGEDLKKIAGHGVDPGCGT
jgi:TRAP-type transport system periplasmic protein